MKKFFSYRRFACGAAVCIFGLVACPALGQVLAKQPVTEADYHLWGTLRLEALSEKGSWVQYRMQYESGNDTLFIKNTAREETHAFPRASMPQFAAERTFACRRRDSLILLDLVSRDCKYMPDVLQYGFSANGDYLVTLEKDASGSQPLYVRNQGKESGRIGGVTEWAWNDAKDAVAYAARSKGYCTVGIIRLKGKYIHEEISASRNPFHTLKWQEGGDGLAFFTTDAAQRPTLQYAKNGKLHMLGPNLPGLPDTAIDPDQNIEMKVSRDGAKVFFGVRSTLPVTIAENPSGVEIWNGNDKVLYPDLKLRESVGRPQLLAAWWPASGKVIQLGTEEMPSAILTGDGNHTLISDPLQYEPDYKFLADRDYWLMDVATGKRRKFLERQSGFPDYFAFSPDGRYIAWFDEGQWNAFDIRTSDVTCLTCGIGAQWDNKISDPGCQEMVWGVAGYTADGKSILIYDFYDIWTVSPDGKNRNRLTRGRENMMQFRLVPPAGSDWIGNYGGSSPTSYDLSQPVFLTSLSLTDAQSGYCILEDGNVTPFAGSAGKITRLSAASGVTAFQQEDFSTPPQVMVMRGGKIESQFRSNPHHTNYAWGKAEMLHYRGLRDSILNMALFYPAGYEPGRKYPMVVRIYDIGVSRAIHDYENPSLENGIGYNIANLTAKGYLVLQPDMNYNPGDTGNSAVYCIEEAVKKVINIGLADPARIGLLGQSFGGYEANFIAGKSKLFAATVSGASISDAVMQYFSVSKGYRWPDAWRWENQQFRMARPFFNNKQGYLENSPILNADGVSAPMLIWAGAQDTNVLPDQSSSLYIALRRLGKRCVMLVYPDDEHSMMKPKNQKDLTRRTEEWFGHFLKGEYCEWITKGTMTK